MKGMNMNVYTSDEQIEAMLTELGQANNPSEVKERTYLKRFINILFLCVLCILGKVWWDVEDAKSRGMVPTVFGYQIYEVKTGSMVPTIPVKSLILTKAVTPSTILEEGDIVTFKNDNQTITHRIVEVIRKKNQISYRTRGDNPENSIDPDVLTQDRIQALYVMKLPFRFTSESD